MKKINETRVPTQSETTHARTRKHLSLKKEFGSRWRGGGGRASNSHKLGQNSTSERGSGASPCTPTLTDARATLGPGVARDCLYNNPRLPHSLPPNPPPQNGSKRLTVNHKLDKTKNKTQRYKPRIDFTGKIIHF